MTIPSLLRFGMGAALGLALAGCGGGVADQDPVNRGEVAVTTALPLQQVFHDSVEAWGKVVADPQRSRSIALAHGGQVMAVRVAVGQGVVRGEVLLRVAPDPATRSAHQQARSALDLAQGELRRTEALAAQRLATQSQLATARKALADAEAAEAAQRAIGGSGAEENVTAPGDGVISSFGVALGERFAANAPLLGFAPAQTSLVELGVLPEDAGKLAIGMPVQLRRVHGAAQDFSARVQWIAQSLDAQTRLLPVRVEPGDGDVALINGSTVRARIRTADYRAWAVPRPAVLHDDSGDYLFQVEQGHARRIEVLVRSSDGDTLGVDGPLDAQAAVIVLGAYELANGDAVREASP